MSALANARMLVGTHANSLANAQTVAEFVMVRRMVHLTREGEPDAHHWHTFKSRRYLAGAIDLTQHAALLQHELRPKPG